MLPNEPGLHKSLCFSQINQVNVWNTFSVVCPGDPLLDEQAFSLELTHILDSRNSSISPGLEVSEGWHFN